jgi:hypothetical protein
MMSMAMVLALALTGQCAGGSCPVPARGGFFAPQFSYPQPAGFTPQGCPTTTGYAAPAKQWFTLTNEPGWQGYGVLLASGVVDVEQRRPLAGVVAATPVAAPVTAPAKFVTCRACGEGQLVLHAGQRCSKCHLMLAAVTGASPAAACTCKECACCAGCAGKGKAAPVDTSAAVKPVAITP